MIFSYFAILRSLTLNMARLERRTFQVPNGNQVKEGRIREYLVSDAFSTGRAEPNKGK